jgi:hypothetical protein
MDVTHLAISLFERGHGEAFPAVASDVHGTPTDIGARPGKVSLPVGAAAPADEAGIGFRGTLALPFGLNARRRGAPSRIPLSRTCAVELGMTGADGPSRQIDPWAGHQVARPGHP